MVLDEDPLSDLFDSPSAPSGPSVPLGYRQGTIVAWNPLTLQNTVRIDRTNYQDLPLIGLAEAESYGVGTSVAVVIAGSTWAIIGAWVRPGTAAAAAALSRLSRRFVASSIVTTGTTSSGTFVDLPGTPGPQVDVVVGPSGKLLILLGCTTGTSDPNVDGGGIMGFQLSGANTLAADIDRSATVSASGSAVGSHYNIFATPAYAEVLTGLTAGLTTVQAKYAVWTTVATDFSTRFVIAIAL